jgi:hypothetical protein
VVSQGRISIPLLEKKAKLPRKIHPGRIILRIIQGRVQTIMVSIILLRQCLKLEKKSIQQNTK